MKTVQQLLESKRHRVVSVTSSGTVFDALKVMAEKEIGAVVVIDNEHLVGIFSERDYARKVVLQGKSSKDTPVREIMTEKVVCVRPDQTVEDCMGLMTDRRIRHLPVLEHKKVIGVVSIGDVVKEMLSEKEFVIRQLESYIHN
ncbi:MAG TPA: CBS domain-containing protein [Burkholderiales bacterium]|nr:CBS domain-containing protein [Burkholderiales bacterium]